MWKVHLPFPRSVGASQSQSSTLTSPQGDLGLPSEFLKEEGSIPSEHSALLWAASTTSLDWNVLCR